MTQVKSLPQKLEKWAIKEVIACWSQDSQVEASAGGSAG